MKCRFCRTVVQDDSRFCHKCGHQTIKSTIKPECITIDWLVSLLESLEFNVIKDINKSPDSIAAFRSENGINIVLLIQRCNSFIRCRTEFLFNDENFDQEYEVNNAIHEINGYEGEYVCFIDKNPLRLVFSERFIFPDSMHENDLITFFNGFHGSVDYALGPLSMFILMDYIQEQDISIFHPKVRT